MMTITPELIERIKNDTLTDAETEMLKTYLADLAKNGDSRIIANCGDRGRSMRVNDHIVGVGTYGNGKNFKAFCRPAIKVGKFPPVSSRWELDEGTR